VIFGDDLGFNKGASGQLAGAVRGHIVGVAGDDEPLHSKPLGFLKQQHTRFGRVMMTPIRQVHRIPDVTGQIQGRGFSQAQVTASDDLSVGFDVVDVGGSPPVNGRINVFAGQFEDNLAIRDAVPFDEVHTLSVYQISVHSGTPSPTKVHKKQVFNLLLGC
jgi:hypothetical protein